MLCAFAEESSAKQSRCWAFSQLLCKGRNAGFKGVPAVSNVGSPWPGANL